MRGIGSADGGCRGGRSGLCRDESRVSRDLQVQVAHPYGRAVLFSLAMPLHDDAQRWEPDRRLEQFQRKDLGLTARNPRRHRGNAFGAHDQGTEHHWRGADDLFASLDAHVVERLAIGRDLDVAIARHRMSQFEEQRQRQLLVDSRIRFPGNAEERLVEHQRARVIGQERAFDRKDEVELVAAQAVEHAERIGREDADGHARGPREREIRGKDAVHRLQERRSRAGPIAKALHDWLVAQRAKVTTGTATAKAIDYSLNRWDALTRYLDDPRLPIDNNHDERQIRPWATGRKNWLFAGTLAAGRRAAVITSLIQSAKLNGHDPYVYLKDVLERLPTQRASEINALLPHRWAPVN